MLRSRPWILFSACLASVAGATATSPDQVSPTPAAARHVMEQTVPARPADDRAEWVHYTRRLAEPVLVALAQRQLKATMPVEYTVPESRRELVTHLEALGRVLAGIAPWLELGADGTPEGEERDRFARLARAAIDAATDPDSPDRMNFNVGAQPLVDAAFLAHAVLRAPNELGAKLEPRVRANLVRCLQSTRVIRPFESNWLLFSSMVEVVLHRLGEPRDEQRLSAALNRFAEWYVGDGMYGDGPEFHWDYYNAYVIHPMLLDILEVVGDETPEWQAQRELVRERARRFAVIQERHIAPDGSFPVIGRSIVYRAGAFQGLAQTSLRRELPESLTPGQARVALTRVLRRTLEAPGTFDDNGWLRLGLAGHQPGLAEGYISTGSLYLCTFALLPLGLPADDPFWTDPPAPTTWEKAWSGQDLPADRALKSP